MSLVIFALIVGIILLWQGANFLVSGAQKVAENLDISPLLIGLTVVALGTSIPEFVVALLAALQGDAGITLGNVIGSNIANIGLVLGLSALFVSMTVDDDIVQKEFPFVLGAPVVLFGLSFDGILSRLDGVILLTIAIIFHMLLIKRVREGRFRRAIEDIAEAAIQRKKKYAPYIVAIILGLVGVIVGAKLTVDGAVGVARIVGLSEVIIGLTIVAIGTSLPELVTSLVAVGKKDHALSLGNVIGSNILNIFVVLGVVLIIVPVTVERSLLIFDIPLMLVFSLLLFIALLEYGRLRKREAMALLIFYIVYVGYSFIK